jgi:hypothetical protein
LRDQLFELDNSLPTLTHIFRVNFFTASLTCLLLISLPVARAQSYPFPTESRKPGSAGTPGFLDREFKSFLGTFQLTPPALPQNPLDPFQDFGNSNQGGTTTVKFLGDRPDLRTAMVQADGKILIGGTFRIQAVGVPFGVNDGQLIANVTWRNLARLNADGTLDTTFISPSALSVASATGNPNIVFGPDGAVYSILVVLKDDLFQYLVAGDFLNFSHNAIGNPAPRLRYLMLDVLAADPSAGTNIQQLVNLSNNVSDGDGFNGPVRKIRRLFGTLQAPNTPPVFDRPERLRRSYPIGTRLYQLDNGFLYEKISGPLANSADEDWEVIPAGRRPLYFATGDFTRFVNDTDERYITRFDFNPGGITILRSEWDTPPLPDRRVWDVDALGPRIFFVGEFNSINAGVKRWSKIASIDETGSIIQDFDPGTGFNNTAMSIVADPIQNNVVVAGYFTEYDGVALGRIARISPLGELVPDFPAPNEGNFSGANGPIRCVTRQPDGRLLIAGEFTSYNGIKRSGLARLEADGSLDLTFSPPGNASGIQNFAFDIDGGPATASLFARAIAVGNFSKLFGSNFSGVARFVGGSLPVIWYEPSQVGSSSALLGENLTLNVVATDNFVGYPGTTPPFEPPQIPSEPLLYQWQKNGKNIEGEVLPYLSLENVQQSDLASYRVWVWNSQFGVLSQPVRVTLRNPFVGVIPPSGLRIEGIIAPNDTLGDIGGSISLTMTPNGLVTGSLVIGSTTGATTRLRIRTQYNYDEGLYVEIPVPNRPPLRLRLRTDLVQGQTVFDFSGLGNSISDTFGNEAAITASNIPWSKTNPATDFAGTYTIGLETDPADLSEMVGTEPAAVPKMPQGFGFLTMRVNATNGQARLAGMLADGTKITASSFIRADQESSIPLFLPLYKSMGALTGQLGIQPDGITNPVQAQLRWSRPAGVPPKAPDEAFVNVSISAVPSSGWLDPQTLGTVSTLTLEITDSLWAGKYGAMEFPITQRFLVSGTKLSPELENESQVSLSINSSSGLASGGFDSLDPEKALRKVKFQGIMTTGAGTPQVFGFFIMPSTAKSPDYWIGGSVTGF